MRLNLHFIQEDLPELGFEGTIVDPPSVARCRTVRLVDTLPPHLDEGVIYVIGAQGLPPSPPKAAKASILCIGDPPEQWAGARLNLLRTSCDVRETDVMNEVIRLFDGYRTWEESLRDLVDQGAPFESLGAEAVAMFGNPIIAQDVSYRLLFYSLPGSEEEGWGRLRTYREVIYGQHVSEGGLSVPRGAAMAFNQNPEFTDLERTKDPVLFSGDTWSELSGHALSFRSLLYNCRAGEDPVARVIVDEVARPLRRKDHVLVKVLGDCLSRVLRSPGAGNAGRDSRFARLCESLIAGDPVADGDLSETMRYLGWHADDEFFCMLLRERDTHRSFSAIAQVAISITARNDSRQYHFVDGRALVVCNLSAGAQGRNESMEGVSRTLQGLDVTASFSSTFAGSRTCPITTGRRLSSSGWDMPSTASPSRSSSRTTRSATCCRDARRARPWTPSSPTGFGGSSRSTRSGARGTSACSRCFWTTTAR